MYVFQSIDHAYRSGVEVGPKDFAQVYAGDVNGDEVDDVVGVYDDGSFEIFLTIYNQANPYLLDSGGVGFHSMGVQTLLVGHRITTVNFIGTIDGYGTNCRGADWGCTSTNQRAVFVGTEDTNDYVWVSRDAQADAPGSMHFDTVFSPLEGTRHRTLSSARFFADVKMRHQALAIGTGRESPHQMAYLGTPGFSERPLSAAGAYEENVAVAAARISLGVNLICFANQFAQNRCHRYAVDVNAERNREILGDLGTKLPHPPPSPPSPAPSPPVDHGECLKPGDTCFVPPHASATQCCCDYVFDIQSNAFGYTSDVFPGVCELTNEGDTQGLCSWSGANLNAAWGGDIAGEDYAYEIVNRFTPAQWTALGTPPAQHFTSLRYVTDWAVHVNHASGFSEPAYRAGEISPYYTVGFRQFMPAQLGASCFGGKQRYFDFDHEALIVEGQCYKGVSESHKTMMLEAYDICPADARRRMEEEEVVDDYDDKPVEAEGGRRMASLTDDLVHASADAGAYDAYCWLGGSRTRLEFSDPDSGRFSNAAFTSYKARPKRYTDVHFGAGNSVLLNERYFLTPRDPNHPATHSSTTQVYTRQTAPGGCQAFMDQYAYQNYGGTGRCQLADQDIYMIVEVLRTDGFYDCYYSRCDGDSLNAIVEELSVNEVPTTPYTQETIDNAGRPSSENVQWAWSTLFQETEYRDSDPSDPLSINSISGNGYYSGGCIITGEGASIDGDYCIRGHKAGAIATTAGNPSIIINVWAGKTDVRDASDNQRTFSASPFDPSAEVPPLPGTNDNALDLTLNECRALCDRTAQCNYIAHVASTARRPGCHMYKERIRRQIVYTKDAPSQPTIAGVYGTTNGRASNHITFDERRCEQPVGKAVQTHAFGESTDASDIEIAFLDKDDDHPDILVAAKSDHVRVYRGTEHATLTGDYSQIVPETFKKHGTVDPPTPPPPPQPLDSISPNDAPPPPPQPLDSISPNYASPNPPSPPSGYVLVAPGHHCHAGSHSSFGNLVHVSNSMVVQLDGVTTYAQAVPACGDSCDAQSTCEGFSVRREIEMNGGTVLNNQGQCQLFSHSGTDLAADIVAHCSDGGWDLYRRFGSAGRRLADAYTPYSRFPADARADDELPNVQQLHVADFNQDGKMDVFMHAGARSPGSLPRPGSLRVRQF